MDMEKQFLMNQFKLDKQLVFLIKDYVFENILVYNQERRYKERNLSYLRERINVKTCIFEMGESNEIVEMPNAFYIKIDDEYEKMTSHLNECWVAVENEIVLLWKKYEIMREKTPNALENKEINELRDNQIDIVLENASTYDASCWKQTHHNIMSHIENFDMEMVIFKDIYFMCTEGRDIYKGMITEDGLSTLYRIGILDEDNDTILIDRHSWWKEIYVSSCQEMCSVNPSTGAIYKHWSYKKANIIGTMYKNEIVLF